MALTQDAKRLLRDNLKTSWSRVGAVIAAVLAWVPVHKGAEALGIEHKKTAVVIFYVASAVLLLFVFLVRSVRQAYEKLGPGVPSQKALAELAAKFFGFEKELIEDKVVIYN